MTTEEKIDKLTNVVESLASSVVAHDDQIEALLKIAEQHDASIRTLVETTESLQKQWQAYINTLPRQ